MIKIINNECDKYRNNYELLNADDITKDGLYTGRLLSGIYRSIGLSNPNKYAYVIIQQTTCGRFIFGISSQGLLVPLLPQYKGRGDWFNSYWEYMPDITIDIIIKNNMNR